MIWVGTSGYNYAEWKGNFYPEKIPAAKMLPYYAEHFPTVEINYTFYRAPTVKILQGWDAATPDPFKLTLKAPRRITHDARLRDCEDSVQHFVETASVLGPKLGVLLFQLPPYLKKDIAVLDAFLAMLSAGAQPRAVRGRQRKAIDARRDHRRLRILPSSGPRVYTGGHRAVGSGDPGEGRALPRRVRLLQARRVGEGTRVRAAAARRPFAR